MIVKLVQPMLNINSKTGNSVAELNIKNFADLEESLQEPCGIPPSIATPLIKCFYIVADSHFF
tara:strand:- start:1575 stop:1763 length:189 start_codon:yes stop_codon:yes gene_type:complete